MAAYSGIIRGASKVFVVDTVPERLAQAKKIGCIPVDFKKSDPVEQIIELNGGMVDRAVDAVGCTQPQNTTYICLSPKTSPIISIHVPQYLSETR